MIKFDPIIERLPFRYKCLFVLYTIPGAVYAIVGLVLCMINPFWFRQQAINGLEQQIHVFGRWRNKLMQKYYDKYSLLSTIKNS